MARLFSIRPAMSLKGRRFKGLRGWSGKPLHPPLTDFQSRPMFLRPCSTSFLPLPHMGTTCQRALKAGSLTISL
jgi:hypothetical protein